MPRPTTIKLIAPSGYPHDIAAMRRGVARLEAAGHVVTGSEALQRQELRFAGSDTERAAEINALADPAQPLPDIVMAVRGGYGAHHLLERLDYEGLGRRLSEGKTILVGHSDFTALQLALLSRAGLTTFAGPMLGPDFGAEHLRDFTWRHFWRTVQAPSAEVSWPTVVQPPVEASGTLWGGNLAMLCSLLGTPYFPSIEGGILFVEDVSEPPYRIERMLYHLHLAGVLERQKALIIGDFSGSRTSEYDNGYDIKDAIARIRAVVDIPIIEDLPFGHCPDKATLPVGAAARLRVAGGEAVLAFEGYPRLS
jgi:muramoyltetrapeptide carboxypeptidase